MSNNSSFPLFPRQDGQKKHTDIVSMQRHKETNQSNIDLPYRAPKITSNLSSFRAKWNNINNSVSSERGSSPLGEQDRRQHIEDLFLNSLYQRRVDIIHDTSITGRYKPRKSVEKYRSIGASASDSIMKKIIVRGEESNFFSRKRNRDEFLSLGGKIGVSKEDVTATPMKESSNGDDVMKDSPSKKVFVSGENEDGKDSDESEGGSAKSVSNPMVPTRKLVEILNHAPRAA